MMSKDVVIIDGMRTAFGRRGGTLKDFLPTDLAALTIKGLVQKTGILERGTVDSLFCGSAFGDLCAAGPARYAALEAGLPVETSASYIEMHGLSRKHDDSAQSHHFICRSLWHYRLIVLQYIIQIKFVHINLPFSAWPEPTRKDEQPDETRFIKPCPIPADKLSITQNM